MLGEIEAPRRRVGDAAALTGELYQLIDEGLADPGSRAMPQGADQDADPGRARPRGPGDPPPAGSASRTTSSSSCPPS